MPFKVSPSSSVVIEEDEVGPDDFLLITNDDKTYLYVKMSEGQYPHLTLDPALLPDGFAEVVDRAARQAIASLQARRTPQLQEVFEAREDQALSLRAFFAEKLLQNTYVQVVVNNHNPGESRELDIGQTVRITFSRHIDKLDLDLGQHDNWTATAQVKSITPIDRFSVLIQEAVRGQ